MASIKGKVERIRDNRVEGWAWLEGADAAGVVLFADGAPVARDVADRKRGDLARAGVGDGRHGFLIDIPETLRDGGVHRFQVRVDGARDFLNAYPLVAVLKKDEEPVEALPSPVAAGIHTTPARTTSQIGAVVFGDVRLAIQGWRDPGAVPVVVRLGDQSVIVTAVDEDGGFVAVFDTTDARVVELDGERIDIVPEAGEVFAAINVHANRRLSGVLLSLDEVQPAVARIQAAGLVTVVAALTAGAVFDADGPVTAAFSTTTAALGRALQARDPGFTADRTLDVALLDEDDAPLASAQVVLDGPVTFNLERFTPERIVGWMADPAHRAEFAAMDLYVDGVRFHGLVADRHRQDVINAGHVTRGGGFSLLPALPGGTRRIQFAAPLTRDFIALKSDTLTLPQSPVSPFGSVSGGLDTAGRRVTVVLPVRNEAQELRERLGSVLRCTAGARILVVDDASQDAELRAVLDGHAGQVEVLRLPTSQGVTAAINAGVQHAGEDDIAILLSGTSATPGWLGGLRAAAFADPRIATATPVSNNAGGFSVPECGADNALPVGLRAAEVARLVRQSGEAAWPRVPEAGAFCLYVRRDALDAVGPFDAATYPNGHGAIEDFSMRAGRAGRIHVVDDRTFIPNRRWAPHQPARRPAYDEAMRILSGRYPEYARLGDIFEDGEAMLAMRWRLRRAWLTAEAPKPRLLFVISTRSGGTPQTNRDLMQALSGSYEPWVLASDAAVVELMRLVDGREQTVETIRLDSTIHPASHKSSSYNDAVMRLLLEYGFELVHIRHLGWHGYDLPRLCKALGLPVVLSLHDYYTVCPNIKLLANDGSYCGGTCTPTPGDCSVELWPQAAFPPLKHRFIHRWQEMSAEMFDHCDAFVTTSESARDVFFANFPMLRNKDFRVIAHGRTFGAVAQLAAKPDPGERLRVLVPGNISPAKGSDLINAIVAQDGGQRLEFHILGDPGRLVDHPAVVRHGLYDREDFASHVAAIRPHIGAVLSVWPETYCHTLTEMWACGLPVLGLDIGAVGERLKAHGGGWRVAHDAGPQAVSRALLAALRDWEARVAEVQAWQDGYNARYGVDEMAAAYDDLYKALSNSLAS